jgi:aminoacyl tRNA synthase complex-interacting multifunctional protein 1
MQNKLVVVLCNLKPAKMRGILSEGMVMCASTPEKVELLSPPENAVPGDLINFAGFERKPDAILNPKKKVWETLMPDFRTDDNLVAKFKDIPFEVSGKGIVTAPSLKSVQIK